jgi:hypothetical protein
MLSNIFGTLVKDKKTTVTLKTTLSLLFKH